MDAATPGSQLDADLAAAAAADRRRRMILAGVVGAIGAISLATYVGLAMGGEAAAIGRTLVGALGLVAGLAMWRLPRQGWMLAMARAPIQIPYYAWSPAGSPTSQALELPLSMANSTRVNGQLVSYSSVGINVVGVIFAGWLHRWRNLFDRPS